ncbi:podocalyxin-like protein 2 isoform X2 [Clinocottus analis]|uniref:podocalyxin-like protein 2 isoform X2 n=1 Tax=Clinocottus analis TaxID=304258 RepID=UPI0035C0A1B5
MPGLLFITLTVLLSGRDAFRLGSSRRLAPLGPSLDRLLQDKGPVRPHFIQEVVRTKRHSVQELVRAQPHLVHDMGRPEVHETSNSQAQMDSSHGQDVARTHSADQEVGRTHPVDQEVARTRPAVEENLGVEDEMERMIHLVGSYNDPETELLASTETSGFYGTDMEDRDRGEEGGEERERRGGEEEEEERRGGEEEATDDDSHTSPDLDALIGYSPSETSSSNQTGLSPAEGLDPGLQEAGAVEPRGEEGLQSSATSPPAGEGGAAGTSSPETGRGTSSAATSTGTDFGLPGSFTRGVAEEEAERVEEEEEEEEEAGLAHRGLFTQNPTVAEGGVAPSREPLQPSVEEEELQEEEHRFKGVRPHGEEEEEEEGTRVSHMVPPTTDPPPSGSFTKPSWDWLEKTTPLQTPRSEVRGGGVPEEVQQVMCVDWSMLSERGYVVLNTTENLSCEEFRVDQGVRLLKVIEQVFARRMNSPEGSWEVYLSKPTHQQHQLLMNVVSEHGVIATTEVLSMLGEIRRMLGQVGIQNYSPPSSCTSRPSPTRSDYGKLFVVLVIIGSVCMVIITSGVVYICWQRRPPGNKTTFRGEELRFVENSCHDNPTLDVTNDNQPETREKKPSTNGLAGGGGQGGGEGEECSRWKVFVNQAATEEEEEEEEQDTHL